MKIIQYQDWDDELSYLFMINTLNDIYTRRECRIMKKKKKKDLAWEFVNEILSISKY